MSGTIRTFDPGMREAIFKDLRNVAGHVSAAHGATVDAQVPDAEGNPVTFNDPALTARMTPSLEAVAGPGNVVEPQLQMGAEDYSYFAREVPSMYFFVGATASGIDPATAPGNHSPLFALDESALDLGLRALLQVTLDYLRAPPQGRSVSAGRTQPGGTVPAKAGVRCSVAAVRKWLERRLRGDGEPKPFDRTGSARVGFRAARQDSLGTGAVARYPTLLPPDRAHSAVATTAPGRPGKIAS